MPKLHTNSNPNSNQTTPKKQEPDDYNQLLAEFVNKAGRGLQKTFIRKLWGVHEDLLENANPSTLRMMYFSPALTVCPEGVKLVAEILPKIGVVNGLALLEKLILQFSITDTECQRYGDVFKTTWKNAFYDANFDLTEELESEVFRTFFQHALYGHKPICTKFQKVLGAFATEKKLDKNVDAMITTQLNGCLFRALGATNHIVLSSAAEILFMFYPIVGEDSEKMEKTLENQHRHMYELLSSDIVSIRTEAVKKVLKAIAEYRLIIPTDVTKSLLSYIIDTLSRDTVVSVRAAVFEGLKELAYVPSCLTSFEHAMNCILLNGMQDKSEKVRLIVYQLLAYLKNHKFSSVLSLVERDEIIAKLDLETVETCRRQLVPIMHILLPISTSLDETYYRPRINFFLGKSRLALLTYFRLLGPMKIIDAESAAKFIEMHLRWAYRYLRRKDGSPPLEESSEAYRRARAYLECALVLYMSCKGMLMLHDDGKSKSKCDQYFGKVVKEVFENYGNTPIIGTATGICSVIPKDQLKGIASDVLARLAEDDVPAEAIEPFLESAINFNPDSVFDSIEKGLTVLAELYGEKKKQTKKKKRDAGSPEEVLSTTLSRLKYILQSHTTSDLISIRDAYRTKVLDLMANIDLICEAIEIRLARGEDEEHSLSDETLLTTLEFRFILPLFAATNGTEDANDRKKTIETTKKLLIWFDTQIAKKMTTFGEHNQDFLVELTRKFLNCSNVALSAYDFLTRPVEFEDDEENRPPENEEGEDQEEEEISVAEVLTRIITSFCNSSTPVEIFCPVLRVATILCEESYSECHPSMANVLRFVPKWINKQCDLIQEDEENLFEKEKEPLEALRQFHKRVSETEYWDENSANRMIHHFVLFSIVSLTATSDDQEFEDPRQESYKPSNFVSFAVVKFILKDKSLTTDFLEEITKNYLPDDSKYFKSKSDEEPEPSETTLVKLAALSQLLRILERNSKFAGKSIGEAIEACVAKALDRFANATDLETVPNHVMNSLTALLDVELPDGF